MGLCGLLVGVFLVCAWDGGFAFGLQEANTTAAAVLAVDASPQAGRRVPDHMFGIFFEEINHAGAGGLWAELVSNRGFEAGGPNTPSNMDPWFILGNESYIIASTDRTSCFSRNRVALRMEVLCDSEGSNICPADGVGISNPGFWGMNIVKGKIYKVVLHVRTLDSMKLSVSLTSSDGLQHLASTTILADVAKMSNWTKVEFLLRPIGTNSNSRLQLTAAKKGVIWFDQVSVMPLDSYKEHGFHRELSFMLADLRPRFLRFPGGSYVEGNWLSDAFQWKETIGPWEERPGHFNDVWKYWTDDGLGYYEFLQLAEDLGASPVWVVNNGISSNDAVGGSLLSAFVKDILNGIEFARGDTSTTWGSVRAAMGHPAPFQLSYVALGNQVCWKQNYQGNYLRFHSAIKASYPDIKIISNCDGSSQPLNHPADLYDLHVYTSANDMFSRAHQFDHTPRTGPKAFVSEYAVTGSDTGTGNLLAALAEAAFLIGLEQNSDVVEMASCAPLFVNDNDRRFNPDAIVFNSWNQYGTVSYWMQKFFKESSGAVLHPSVIQTNTSAALAASAITWQSSKHGRKYLKIKIVNFGNDIVNVTISIAGLQDTVRRFGSRKTILTSENLTDENSFTEPSKVIPMASVLRNAGARMNVVLSPHSLSSFDLSLASKVPRYVSSRDNLHRIKDGAEQKSLGEHPELLFAITAETYGEIHEEV